MRIRDRFTNVLALFMPIFNQKLKDSFEFTKRISDFVGILVRMGILLAFMTVIYESSPAVGQEAIYYTSLIFFGILYAVLWVSVFRLFSDVVDTVIAAWMGEEFNFDAREFIPAVKGKRFRHASAIVFSLVVFVLLHSGMEYGINAYLIKN